MKTTRLHIDALTAPGLVNERSELIGRDDLALIIEELTAALEPCGEPVARAEARRLAACYPTFRPSPEWLEQIEDALKSAPCDLIRRASQTVSETAQFPPNKAQVKEAVQILRDKRCWVLMRAKMMMDEHDRRDKAEAEDARRREGHETFRAKLAGRSPLEFFRDEGEK